MIRSSDVFWAGILLSGVLEPLVPTVRADSHISSQLHVLVCHIGSLKSATEINKCYRSGLPLSPTSSGEIFAFTSTALSLREVVSFSMLTIRSA